MPVFFDLFLTWGPNGAPGSLQTPPEVVLRGFGPDFRPFFRRLHFALSLNQLAHYPGPAALKDVYRVGWVSFSSSLLGTGIGLTNYAIRPFLWTAKNCTPLIAVKA